MLVRIRIILPEEIGHKLIIVNNSSVFVSGGGIKLPKESIHGLWIKFEVSLYFLHPSLVHSVEVILYYVSDLEIDQGILFVQVDFDDVSNE